MNDSPPDAPNQAQIDYWNANAGATWVRYQAHLDRQLGPLGEAAADALEPVVGDDVLDIGCGSGATSLALAARVAPGGSVLGVDISEPMLDLARRRAAARPDLDLAFTRLDAQTADLGVGRFDRAFSRFGVMFFSDPTAAFANIRAALKPGGRLAFVCWRSVAENPMMSAPSAAAAHLLPPSPPADPLAPGPFAFADADRVRGILEGAGFSEVTVTPLDTMVDGGSLEAAVDAGLHVGPLSRALQAAPLLRDDVVSLVREALRVYLVGDRVRLPVAVWIVRAVNL